jgi:hypothetical protein
VHSLNIFGVKTNHGQTRIHKTHHGPDMGETTTFPLILYYVPLHKAHIQMAFCPGTPKWDYRKDYVLPMYHLNGCYNIYKVSQEWINAGKSR